MSTIVAYAQFTASKVGKAGLTATVDVKSVNRSTGATATVATGAGATELIRGVYFYRVTSADLQTYDYVATFITADTSVDQQEVPALWTRFSEAVATDAAGAVAANNLPSDYQQRGVAVTLPANPPAGFLATASYATAPGWYAAPPSDYQQRGVAVTLPANPPANFLVTASYSTAPGWYTAPDNADIAAIKAKTDNLPASPAAVGSSMVLAGAGLDSVVIEAGINLRQAAALMLAALAGKAGGLEVNAPVFKGANTTTTRIAATTDSSGNRTAVTLTPPA